MIGGSRATLQKLRFPWRGGRFGGSWRVVTRLQAEPTVDDVEDPCLTRGAEHR